MARSARTVLALVILAVVPSAPGLTLPAPQAGEDSLPIVIANPSLPVEVLDRETLLHIYEGKISRVEGTAIVLTTHRSEAIHAAFVETYLGRTPQQVRNYWRKMVFSGRGRLPRSFATEAEVVRFVADTRGAIGYIARSTPHDGVKVVGIE